MLLYGMSLVYGFTGQIGFAEIAARPAGRRRRSLGLVFGLVFVLAGIAFKISAVPFHMWTPDVYEGAPTPVTAFFAAAPKVAAMAILVRIVAEAFQPIIADWQQIIVFISIASMAARRLRRHRPDEHQAPDGLFLDRPHGLCAGRSCRRHAGRRVAASLIYMPSTWS